MQKTVCINCGNFTTIRSNKKKRKDCIEIFPTAAIFFLLYFFSGQIQN